MINRTLQQGMDAADRLTIGNNSNLFVWAIISMVVNVLLMGERVGVVEFHPEQLTGLYALAETAIEGSLRWGTLLVTLLVGIRALRKRLKE